MSNKFSALNVPLVPLPEGSAVFEAGMVLDHFMPTVPLRETLHCCDLLRRLYVYACCDNTGWTSEIHLHEHAHLAQKKTLKQLMAAATTLLRATRADRTRHQPATHPMTQMAISGALPRTTAPAGCGRRCAACCMLAMTRRERCAAPSGALGCLLGYLLYGRSRNLCRPYAAFPTCRHNACGLVYLMPKHED